MIGKIGHQIHGGIKMNERILENIYEGVLEEFPHLDKNESTRVIAKKIATEMFFEGGLWKIKDVIGVRKTFQLWENIQLKIAQVK